MSDARFAVFRPAVFLRDAYHNGDTWRFDIDCGYNVHFFAAIRILGYNAPERNSPDGPKATAYGRAKLLAARDIMVKTTEKQSFERWLGNIQVDGKDLGQILQTGKNNSYDL